MKPIDVKTSTHFGFEVEHNDKYHKFKVHDCVTISIYKNIFAKGWTPKWSDEVFEIDKFKSLYHGNM